MGTKLVLIEAVSLFHNYYVVEVPEDADWAADVVTGEEADWFASKHIDESILDTRDITIEEARELWVKHQCFPPSLTGEALNDYVNIHIHVTDQAKAVKYAAEAEPINENPRED